VIFGQTDTTQNKQGVISYREEAIDSSLAIIDDEKVNYRPAPSCYINGKFYQYSIFASGTSLGTDSLTDMKVCEEDTIVNGELYHGKLYFTVANEEFSIKEISLSDIRTKYTNINDSLPLAFILNGDVITRNYDTYLMDENALSLVTAGEIKDQGISYVNISTNAALNKDKIHHTTADNEVAIKGISLSDIRTKYTNIKDSLPVIFIVEGDIVTTDYDTYLIDENDLYTISTGINKNQGLSYVKILTKTEENIKFRNRFFVGGILWRK
jgi:hypothetical protein